MRSPVTYGSKRYLQANNWDRRNLRIVHEAVAPQPGERLLEVGCGRGHLVKALRDEGIDATGVDINPHVVEHGACDSLAAMPADDLSFTDAAFDVVISFHMIEHVPQIDPVLADMTRVLRPGGRLLLVYPAEPFRGAFAIPASVVMFGHPFRARRIHLHAVRPRTLHPRVEAAGLQQPESRFRMLTTPQFQTVASKPLPHT